MALTKVKGAVLSDDIVLDEDFQPVSDKADSNESRITGAEGRITTNEQDIIALQQGQSSGTVGYATRADLYADTGQPIGTIGIVTNDSTSSYNGSYRWDGAAWTKASDAPLENVKLKLRALQTPFIGRLTRFQTSANISGAPLMISTSADLWWVNPTGSHGSSRCAQLTDFQLDYPNYMWFDTRIVDGSGKCVPQQGSASVFYTFANDPEVELFAAHLGQGNDDNVFCSLSTSSGDYLGSRLVASYVAGFYPNKVYYNSSTNKIEVTFDQKLAGTAMEFVGNVFGGARSAGTPRLRIDTPIDGDIVFELAANEGIVVEVPHEANGNGPFTVVKKDIQSQLINDRNAFAKTDEIILLARVSDNAGNAGVGTSMVGVCGDYAQILLKYGDILTPETGITTLSRRNNGMFGFSGSSNPPVFNPNTKVLSWDSTLIIPIQSKYSDTEGNFDRVKIPAGSIDLTGYTGGYWQAYIDASDIPSTEHEGIDLARIKIERYYSNTLSGGLSEDKVLNLFTWNFGLLDEVSFPAIKGTPKWNDNSGGVVGESFDEDQLKVVVTQATEEYPVVFVYYKAGRSESNKYIKWRFERRPIVGINSDTWHTQRAWEVEINTDGTETITKEVIIGGENETAIREDGKADFMGGTAHGDEETLWDYMKVDGKEIDYNVSDTYYCSQFELTQKSQLWEEGTNKLNKFGVNFKRWKVKRYEVECQQRTELEKNADISSWYHTLWCVNRDYSYDLARAPYWEREDGTPGHALIYSFTNHAQGWGADGIQYEAKILENDYNGTFVMPRLFFQTSGAYNKFYFDSAFSLPATMNIGDVMQTRHVYIIKTNN